MANTSKGKTENYFIVGLAIAGFMFGLIELSSIGKGIGLGLGGAFLGLLVGDFVDHLIARPGEAAGLAQIIGALAGIVGLFYVIYLLW